MKEKNGERGGEITHHPLKLPSSPIGMHPRWVHTQSTSHSSFLTRPSPDCGSRMVFQSTWRTLSILSCVRWWIKTGLSHHKFNTSNVWRYGANHNLMALWSHRNFFRKLMPFRGLDPEAHGAKGHHGKKRT